MWYYMVNQQQFGPVDEAKIREAIARGLITSKTMVWRQGMPNWVNILSTDLKRQLLALPQPEVRLPPAPMVETSSPSPSSQPSVFQDSEIRTNEKFFLVYWICFAVGSFFSTVLGLIPFVGIFGKMIGFPILIASIIFLYILHYRFWMQIPPQIARTTPGKAVGFCFIPFFNLYWLFVSFYGLALDMNRTLSTSSSSVRANDGLVLAWCIVRVLSIFSWPLVFVPFIGELLMIPVTIAEIVLAILSIINLKQCAAEIIKVRS